MPCQVPPGRAGVTASPVPPAAHRRECFACRRSRLSPLFFRALHLLSLSRCRRLAGASSPLPLHQVAFSVLTTCVASHHHIAAESAMAAGTARTAAAAAAAVTGLAVAVAAAALLSPAAAADFDDEEGTIACSLLSWRRRPEWSKRAQTTWSAHSFLGCFPALIFFFFCASSSWCGVQ